MDQHRLMSYEQGMDHFIADLKAYLVKREHAHFQHCSMPQCLHSLTVTGQDDETLILRLVVVGWAQDSTLARLSWLDRQGRDHVCCYLNEAFEAIKRKRNGKWVREKYTPQDLCLQQWSHLQATCM